MALKERLTEDMKSALRNRETVRLGMVRMIRAQIKNREIAKGSDLVDEEAVEVVSSLIKSRKEALEFAVKGDRQDLVAQAEEELEILASYLPEQLSEEEIRSVVREVIEQSGAAGPGDLGRVMGAVMPRVKGRADGRLVNTIVRECLAGLATQDVQSMQTG
ncbi:MAG: GatB/YqeY domain-containing protein [Gemmatimonadetes bacterium]|nr:GatB/YqeY domain-containing protein [Gemmatimonadota bacterium]MYG15668.1 GatB/YqeY domain-containing protein [Gemmatimonadota bacterium]MYH19880.1 GatB/YqeY domain-containing protein [Gemmatimonadota bacterium]